MYTEKNLWTVCLTATWPLVYVRHDLFACNMTHKCATWVCYVWNMTQSCIRKRISGQYASRRLDLLFMCDMACLRVTWLIKRISGQYVSRLLDLLSMCNMTCLCATLLAKRISRPYASRRLDLSSMCDMTCWCATWLIKVRHESFTYGTWLSHVYGKESLDSVSHDNLTFGLCATWLVCVRHD